MIRRLIPAGGVVLVVLAITTCGGRVDTVATNQDLVTPLRAIPNAEPVAVEQYGYDLGDGRSEDRFFTELEYSVAGAVRPSEILSAVGERLGAGWDVATTGDGDAVLATFHRGDARVAVTTWDGGFDITVAAEGAKLDGTRLAL